MNSSGVGYGHTNRTRIDRRMTMGFWSTLLSFGAGYALGANKDKEIVKDLQGKARGVVAERLPSSFRSRGDRVDLREVREVMTALPQSVTPDTTIAEAARRMAEGDMGDVLITDKKTGRLVGIVTDRDITIRAIATGQDPATTAVRTIMSADPTTVAPTDTVQEAIARMRSADVRRLPVIEDGISLGVVSLGDLSQETDAGPALADISNARPDR
jgi:CBS domain-containing protein